ncbi:hypothetical protein [Microbacterium sp. 2FI]|uniref:hypothetical protein n=1 Tax=Microbacterium sp. 2FI TaxID=2502193 RepID=UPI0010F9CBB5|nr:hypothetical protein [Microbacterium sp. 2FI]
MPIANYTTQSSVDKTMGEVIGALTRRGVTRISTVFGSQGEPTGVEFTMQTEFGPRDFALPIRTDGVLATLKRDKVQPRYATPEHAARVAWAIARDWLRAQTALIDAGLMTLDEVMFPWMVAGGRNPQTAFEAYRGQQKAIES